MTDKGLTAPARLVVFYDCCVSRPIAEEAKRRAPFAEHIDVRQVFRPRICNRDLELFKHILEMCADKFTWRKCFFVTSDKKFYRWLKCHPAIKDGLIGVIHFRRAAFKDRDLAREENQRRVEQMVAGLREIFEGQSI